MNDQERIDELMRTVDRLKGELARMQGAIAQRNAEVNKLRSMLRAGNEKQRIDAAMQRFAMRENSFK